MHKPRSRRRTRLAWVLGVEAALLVAGLGIWKLSSLARRPQAPPRPALVLLAAEVVGSAELGVLPAWLAMPWIVDQAREVLPELCQCEVRDGPASSDASTRTHELRLHLALSSAETSDTGTTLVANLALECRVRGHGRLPETHRATANASGRYEPSGTGPLSRGLVRGLLDEALRQAFHEAMELVTLADAPPEFLLASAREGKREHRAAALRALGERRAPEALPTLLAALGEAEHDIVLAAVGGLVALGDLRAVPALIDSSRDRGPEYLAQTLYALASIGGPDAEAYLDTLVVGHDQAAIRARAEDALQQLRRTRAGQALRATP